MCSKSRKCRKQDRHSGKCKKDRQFHPFWETSRFQVRNSLKREFSETNAQLISDYERKKWWQVTRANYVRAFYLPEHHPMPSMYISHYESRMPSHITKADNCQCGRKKSSPEEQLCTFCVECKYCSRMCC